MRPALLLLSLPLFLLALAPTRADEKPSRESALDPDLPYQAKRSTPVTYDVDFSAVVTAPYHTKKLRVWLPLPQTDAGQEVEEISLGSSPMEVKPKISREEKYGNRFAYFEFDHPEGAQRIRHRFKVKVWELRWEVDRSRVARVERWPAGFDRYLKPDQSIVMNDPLRRVLKGIVTDARGPAEELAAALTWAQDNLTYDHANASLKASALHALEQRRGHCSDYHGLCAAFGRALGYPTRVTYGINPFPKNSPSHCKLEVYLPPYGWVSFDVSETQRLVAAINKAPGLTAQKKEGLVKEAKERFLSGFRDNTWFLQTRGTDYDLAPAASKRAPVVRTIYAEADGVALPDPDPANPKQREFAWMTIHKYTPDRVVPYPFADWKTLPGARTE
jgi:transglutaminase-like putative cysteine protease